MLHIDIKEWHSNTWESIEATYENPVKPSIQPTAASNSTHLGLETILPFNAYYDLVFFFF